MKGTSLSLNRQDFLVLYFSVAKVSRNIYSGVNFARVNVCGNFYLRELIFANCWKNRENRKN